MTTKTIHLVHDAILKGAITPAEIAAQSNCTPGTARKWARRLAEQGLVAEDKGSGQNPGHSEWNFVPEDCGACFAKAATTRREDGTVLCDPCDAVAAKRDLERLMGLPQGTLEGTDSTGAELVEQARAKAEQVRQASRDVEGEAREALAYMVKTYDAALEEFMASVAKHGPIYTVGWRAAPLAQHETQAKYAKASLASEDVLATLASMVEQITRKLIGCRYDESSTNAISNELTRAEGRGASRFLETATFWLALAKQREEARNATK